MEIKLPAGSESAIGDVSRDVNANYRFTITNRMGNPQNYVIFAKAPEISPKPDIVNTNVVVALRGVSSDAYFSMPTDPIYALCGTSNDELRDHGITIEVEDAMKVNLGQTLPNGGLTPGTTCDVRIQDQALVFAPPSTSPDQGPLNSFCIKTSDEFTYTQSKTRKTPFISPDHSILFIFIA
ncbi:uncharacterized protein FTOL_07187 [Fusarium torulosum]|uniref:Uncharacterized protein n=1 Tax=Fusarium torulosum TaxID=33205 RepID=A0AAE8MCV0_9HYPO|nr:uncharacterized protein FTOL_07187 [Fusarium torulosum]